MKPSIDDFRSAGLYDPDSAGAAERLELLNWLVVQGATIDQLRATHESWTFGDLAAQLGRLPEARITLAEAAELAGITVERIEAFRFAVGLPALAADEPAMNETEARSLHVFAAAEEMFTAPALRRFMQVVGTSLGRIAEAAIALSLTNLVAPMRESGQGELDLAKVRYRSGQAVPVLSEVLAHFFRAHVELAIRRIGTGLQGGVPGTAPMAVGFLDLVGFTALSRRVELRELESIIERFEEKAFDVTTAGDARVVKFIGDEVMFVSADATTACDTALSLLEAFADDETVKPRGAIAMGEVLIRGGDYYGPVVNLAARAAELAAPDEVLITEEIAARKPVGFALEPAGRRTLKGIDEPVRFLAVHRDDGNARSWK